MTRPWWETHPRKFWTREDWAAARKAGVVPPPPPDIEDTAERLLTQAAMTGPKISWGPPASQADARRREANRLLEKLGLRPRRW
jgi:hypothetical protein